MDKPTLDFLSEENKIIEPPKGRLRPISKILPVNADSFCYSHGIL